MKRPFRRGAEGRCLAIRRALDLNLHDLPAGPGGGTGVAHVECANGARGGGGGTVDRGTGGWEGMNRNERPVGRWEQLEGEKEMR